MIGSIISHYKILEKLGEGGMGVVYKAQDTKLNRTVALKFLPERVNQDPTAKERFLQEAQAAAGLNHSNICTVHGVEEHEGNLFIVMEYIDGGTLREKLPYTKVDDALRVAVQIGEALQEAHAKNIVHRDIKADNIMLASKGQAKVMDFGLAKLKGALKLTRSSSTVGTLAYMAPEQIQGGEVDTRSDIFSFGVLLFEMLTGKTPFRGEHEAAMMYSILNEEPEPLQKYLPDASPDLLHMLNRVLEKDPADRYQSAADMVSELRRLLKQSSRITKRLPPEALIPPTQQERSEEPQQVPKSSKTRQWTIFGGIGILVLATLLYALFFMGGGTSGATRLNPDMTLRVLPIPFSQFSYPGLSKDGNWIAFPAADANNKWDIYYMHVSGSNVRRLTTDSLASGTDLNADISPDGSQVVYSGYSKTGQFMISIVPSVGGPSKILAEDALLPRWRPDGQRIGFIRTRDSKTPYPFWSMKADGSDQRLEYADTLMAAFRFSFNWSPDGNSLAWIRSANDGSQEIFTHELQSGKELQLTSDRKNADDVAWTRNGYIIYSSNRGGNTNLWMTPVGGGTSLQLTKGSGPDIGISVSADNQKLVYLQQQRIGRIWNTDLSSFSSKQLTFDDRPIGSVALSPDGNKIALQMGGIDPLKPGVSLYIQDWGGADRRQVTTADGYAFNPAWSSDGKWVSFTQLPLNAPGDSAKIFFVDAFNPGTPKFLADGFRSFWLSPDRLVVRRSTTTNGNAVISDELVSLDGSTQGTFLGDSLISIDRAAGNMVLYADLHQKTRGTWIVHVDYYKNPSKYKPRKLPSIQEDVLARSMRFAYYVTSRNELWRLEYSTGRQERVRVSPPGLDAQSRGSVSYDDKNFVYVTYQLSGKLVMIENIFK